MGVFALNLRFMPDPKSKIQNPKYTYVAYPMSLALKAANAIQTYHTARELRARW